MLKHFLAVMLLFVLAVSTYSQSIPSGTGRYSALGSSPFILDASTDIFNNPAWNNYYRNYAFSDLNQFGESNDFNGNAGVTFGIGKKWNLGMIINRRQDSWSVFSGFAATSPIVPFMGLIGVSASKNFHISLAPYVSMGNFKYTDTTNSTSIENSAMSIGANLGFIYMIKKGWVEGAVRFRMNSFKNDTSFTGFSSVTDNTGGMEFGLSLRGWIYPTTGSKVAVVPILGFSAFSFTPQNTTTSGGTTVVTTYSDASLLSINGGVGLNWPIMDDIQIAGGVSANYNTLTVSDTVNEVKSTNFIAPAFNMALETRITDWMTARLGFNKHINMAKTEINGGIIEASGLFANSDASTISLGAGFHFGRFSIDATVSERWLKNGPNYISGQDGGDLFGILSASYNFAK
jgi:hypothetical protein